MLQRKLVLESCIETIEEAIYAAKHGASQLEVCSQLEDDGLTPSVQLVEAVLSAVQIPCKPMIRIRSGDFIYSEDEINSMIRSIRIFKSLPVSGFAFGALMQTDNNGLKLDLEAISAISKAAFPIPITIHKAIDKCSDILEEISHLRKISNVAYILSSGGAETAVEGSEMLRKMKKIAGHIEIIAAGKIKKDNVGQLADSLGFSCLHGRKIV